MKNKQIMLGIVLSSITLISMAAVGIQANAYSNIDYVIEDLQIDDFNRDRDCLATNIYHEARDQSELGMRAVAYVTINRTHDDRYPSDICGVVFQAVKKADGSPARNKCQFSWYCDGKSDKISDEEMWKESERVAAIVLTTYGYSFDPTQGAVMYHTDEVKPYWRKSYEKTTVIESHIFYR